MAASSKISIIIPTLNSAAVLTDCLQSIVSQKYQNFEILLVDGGSTDHTLSLAHKYNCKIIHNPLKTAESAKALGVRHARGKYLAFIDSDNILPTSDWLSNQINPLETNPEYIGSEPWEYTYRPTGGFIERWSALTGVNDPYTLVAGNYDRRSHLHPHWTGLKLPITNYQYYQTVTLLPDQLTPTIGANGTVFRSTFIKKYLKGDYFYDIDLLNYALDQTKQPILFVKTKQGIVHSYCESSFTKFINKQQRRSVDLYIYQAYRTYPLTQNNLLPTLKYIFYVILIFPMLWDTFRGYISHPDLAWFFHPIACTSTLIINGISTIKFYLRILKPINRQQWQQ